MKSVSSQTTVQELTLTEPQSIDVLKRFGIELRCGHQDMTLAAICAQQHVELSPVLDGINVTLKRGTQLTQDELNHMRMDVLASHIEQTHHTYLRAQLPFVADLIHKVIQAHGSRYPHMVELRLVFEQLHNEILSHMEKEEQILFPWIHRLANIQPSGNLKSMQWGDMGRPIRVMEMDHKDAHKAMASIGQLTNNFQVPKGAPEGYKAMVVALKELDTDLNEHILKENNFLFPKALEAESVLKQLQE